jgi:hypothetical protein
MREHHPELIVQPVTYSRRPGSTWGLAKPNPASMSGRPAGSAGYVFRGAVVSCVGGAGMSFVSTGERHRESAKIRIEPPAVRTYSTFPAEIQL